MGYQINFTKKAKKQIEKIQKDKKLLTRFLEIIEDIKENTYSSNFKFERLKHNLSGLCSKRLDKKNRILYQVLDGEIVIIIISVLGHYDD